MIGFRLGAIVLTSLARHLACRRPHHFPQRRARLDRFAGPARRLGGVDSSRKAKHVLCPIGDGRSIGGPRQIRRRRQCSQKTVRLEPSELGTVRFSWQVQELIESSQAAGPTGTVPTHRFGSFCIRWRSRSPDASQPHGV